MCFISTCSLRGCSRAEITTGAHSPHQDQSLKFRNLDLPNAEQLLWERNLSIVANRFQLDAAQQARLITGYKPNPFVLVGLEQVPFQSPIPMLARIRSLRASSTKPSSVVGDGVSAQAGTRLAEAQRHRDLWVGFEYQRVGSDNSAGIIAQVPLFLYNSQKAGIAQAVAQEHAAETQLKQTELQAVTDVQKAFQGYLGARQLLDLNLKDNLIQLQKLVDIAQFSYTHGATSLFKLLDARRTLRQIQTAYSQARENYQLAIGLSRRKVLGP
ncbi:MAG: Outer rane efflux protein [Bryobacterales bacterium]|nr:Outer rane efflux protein [Bryobacterales bacterium]